MEKNEVNITNCSSRNPNGYLKTCRYCGERIYMYKTDYGWMPFESWCDGKVQVGEFIPHNCSALKEIATNEFTVAS